jgi:16S rRNA (guanine1207-N2)-methyltransferase
MPRKNRSEIPRSQRPVPEEVRSRLRPPLAVVLGSPAEVVNLLAAVGGAGATCYQMDLHQAERLRAALAERGLPAAVVTLPDLWDLPADFQSAAYLPAHRGERELKIDMVEQAFHVLKPRGAFVIWSSYEADPFFPSLLKKIFGRAHVRHAGADSVLWAHRDGAPQPSEPAAQAAARSRRRRRHEVTFQARIAGGPSCRFLSRPGTFSYGRFDNGARALAEVMQVEPGDRVVDIGCGCGTNGVFAWQHAGPDGFVTFVDSNVRAAALAEHNARQNGVAPFEVIATAAVEGPPEGSYDVALANPPYYAGGAVARLFIERARALLKPSGRLYLVTKQPGESAALLEETFGAVEAFENRGYMVLCA